MGLLSCHCFPISGAKLLPLKIRRVGNTGKYVFWKRIVNDQRPKLKLQVNGIETEGLMDTGAAWNSEWPLQKVYTQILGIGKLSQIKHSVQELKCVGSEGQIGRSNSLMWLT